MNEKIEFIDEIGNMPATKEAWDYLAKQLKCNHSFYVEHLKNIPQHKYDEMCLGKWQTEQETDVD